MKERRGSKCGRKVSMVGRRAIVIQGDGVI